MHQLHPRINSNLIDPAHKARRINTPRAILIPILDSLGIRSDKTAEPVLIGAADDDGGGALRSDGLAAAVIGALVVLLAVCAGAAVQLVDDAGDVAGCWAAGGGLADDLLGDVLAGEEGGGVGEGEGEG